MTAPRRFTVLLGLAVSIAVWALAAAPARASGDLCEPRLRLDLGALGECDDATAALSPGNDTRANLLMLLFDRHGLPPSPPAATAGPIRAWRDFRDAFAPGGAPSGGTYAAGEGSRCRSDAAGASAFGAAVAAAASVPPGERASLIAARADLRIPGCTATPDAPISDGLAPSLPALRGTLGEAGTLPTPAAPASDAASGLRSDLGRAFAIYLRGVDAFYSAQFEDAESAFASLAGSSDPWLADTATYMVARTGVNLLQANAFDDYGTLKASFTADPTAAARVEASLDAYLKAYPDGRYVGSARGLLRRVDWLAGWIGKLAERYAALMAQPAAVRGVDDLSLVEEIDDKLLPKLTTAMTRDPLLLAVMDLKAMRRDGAKDGAPPARPDLDGQRDAFAGMPALYELLTAASSFYVDGASAPVLRGLADDTRRRDGDYLWFSRQLLRGQALEAAKDRNARGFWRELDPGAGRPLTRSLAALALALHDEGRGRIDELFALDSTVTDPTMREILIENDAGPALLRARARDASAPAREREVALFTLLYKGLTRGLYADFLADLGTVPADATAVAGPGAGPAPIPGDGGVVPLGLFARGETAGEIGCPSLPATASRLATDPASTRARLCIAEFVRLNGMDDTVLDKPPRHGDLGGGPTAFPGQPYARSAIYASIIADRGASAEDRAYALSRAVRCYEPSGDNGCGGPAASKATRHAWFTALKHDYPGSRWARRLTLWW